MIVVTTAGGQFFAMGDRLPEPLELEDVLSLTDQLACSKQQRTAVTQLHGDYLASCQSLQRGTIDLFLKEQASLTPKSTAEQRIELITRHAGVERAIAALDDDFYRDLKLILTDTQHPIAESAALLRQRQRLQVNLQGGPMSRGIGTDLVAFCATKSPSIEDQEGYQETLRAYGANRTAAFRRLHREDRERRIALIEQEGDHEERIRELIEAAGNDPQAVDPMEMMAVIMPAMEGDEQLDVLRSRIRTQDRLAAHRVASTLSSDAQEAFLDAFYRQTYPTFASAHVSPVREIDQAMNRDDLKDATAEAIASLRVDHLETSRTLLAAAAKVLDTTSHTSPMTMMIMSGGHGQGIDPPGDPLESVRRKQHDRNYTTLTALAELLGEEPPERTEMKSGHPMAAFFGSDDADVSFSFSSSMSTEIPEGLDLAEFGEVGGGASFTIMIDTRDGEMNDLEDGELGAFIGTMIEAIPMDMGGDGSVVIEGSGRSGLLSTRGTASGFAKPISHAQAMRIAGDLGVNEGEAAIIDARHGAYLEDLEPTLKAIKARETPRPMDTHDKRVEAMDSVREADTMFFGDLTSMVDDDQHVVQLQESRRRTLSIPPRGSTEGRLPPFLGFGATPEAGVDLLAIAETLDLSQISEVTEILTEWSATSADLYERIWTIRSLDKAQRREDSRRFHEAIESGNFDSSMVYQPGSNPAAATLMEAEARLVALTGNAVEELDAILSDEQAAALRISYLTALWPAAFNDRDSARGQLKAAAALEDMTIEQRHVLFDIRLRWMSQWEGKSMELVEAMESSPVPLSSMTMETVSKIELAQKRQDAIRFERRQISEQAREEMRHLLQPAQQQRVPGLNTP
jgi:hypothetical protein